MGPLYCVRDARESYVQRLAAGDRELDGRLGRVHDRSCRALPVLPPAVVAVNGSQTHASLDVTRATRPHMRLVVPLLAVQRLLQTRLVELHHARVDGAADVRLGLRERQGE